MFSKHMLSLMVAGSLLVMSCDKQPVTEPTYKGAEVTVGSGKAYSWLSVTADGTPTAMGITLNSAALTGLPHNMANYVLPLPAEASARTPFNHIGLDWMHAGHEPAGVYNVPHFDAHFYIMSQAERAAIVPYDVDSTKYNNLPTADYMPAGYFRLPGGVPTMGVHWLNAAIAPELSGGTFTQTFVYGTYDGKVVFYEPMLALSFLQNAPNVTKDVPLPAKFSKTGYYPSKYSIKNKKHTYFHRNRCVFYFYTNASSQQPSTSLLTAVTYTNNPQLCAVPLDCAAD
jgi:hypothetical protein